MKSFFLLIVSAAVTATMVLVPGARDRALSLGKDLRVKAQSQAMQSMHHLAEDLSASNANQELFKRITATILRWGAEHLDQQKSP